MAKMGQLPGSWRVEHDPVSPELAKRLYAEVQELAVNDGSPVNIARRLSETHSMSISPGTIRHWMVGDRTPQGRKGPNIFKPEPTRVLSYVIGANRGDGCTLTKSWIVKLEVTDLDFAQTFNRCMAKIFGRRSPNRILKARGRKTSDVHREVRQQATG